LNAVSIVSLLVFLLFQIFFNFFFTCIGHNVALIH
jgi:hypothetical protein